jgi:adenosylcobinamide amidohydrolase
MRLRHDPPWLEMDLGAEMPVLSFAPHRPGLVRADRVLWREVRDADLTEAFDAHSALAGWLAERGAVDAVCFLTSRDLGAHVVERVEVGGVRAEAVATVGLGNAERIGTRVAGSGECAGHGTINVAARLSLPLSAPALIEALTLAAEARTCAVQEAGHRLPTGPATGTGTDCLAVAAPAGRERHAGKHTAAGEALGRAVHRAVLRGARDWMAEVGGGGQGGPPRVGTDARHLG